METQKLLEKPFRLMAIVGCVFILTMVILTVFTGFSYEQSVMPFAKTISYAASTVAFLLCTLSFFFFEKHLFYYSALEILVFSNIYNGRIYTGLFLTAILFILLLLENRLSSKPKLIIYLILEIIKFLLVIPYGVRSFFEYFGITLFSLASIGCINLLFRHAYSKKDPSAINLENYRLSERQKNCIKEIVVNNTTIKALAIDYNVSESAIKKDLAHIYNALGITGKADLKALFIGYEFK